MEATLTRVETVTDDGAVAIAVQATLRLSGTIIGGPLLDIPVGTVILAEARCERPLGPSPTPTPTQPTASPTVGPTQPPTVSPVPTLPVTGSEPTQLWWLFGVGAAMVALGGTATLILRRRSIQ